MTSYSHKLTLLFFLFFSTLCTLASCIPLPTPGTEVSEQVDNAISQVHLEESGDIIQEDTAEVDAVVPENTIEDSGDIIQENTVQVHVAASENTIEDFGDIIQEDTAEVDAVVSENTIEDSGDIIQEDNKQGGEEEDCGWWCSVFIQENTVQVHVAASENTIEDSGDIIQEDTAEVDAVVSENTIEDSGDIIQEDNKQGGEEEDCGWWCSVNPCPIGSKQRNCLLNPDSTTTCESCCPAGQEGRDGTPACLF
eukprot:GFUD01038615.1.p1 GENE.GFUD01038615.1~~GFUD01038615.1.p1  ORF type:complete len:252 (-),score=56.75 GFUD01038615.1:139-894(-)